jgi:coiled-coil domain-containing protein 130
MRPRAKLYICQCHTDLQNAAYEVFEGAKKKDEDWNPVENGGFAVHGIYFLASKT